jgi:hypothetical protein
MPGGSQMTAFDYPLHIDERRGSPVELDGVPQVPLAAYRYMQKYTEDDLHPDLEQQTAEAACWVIINRRLAKLAKEERVVVPQGDDEDDGCFGK